MIYRILVSDQSVRLEDVVAPGIKFSDDKLPISITKHQKSRGVEINFLDKFGDPDFIMESESWDTSVSESTVPEEKIKTN